MENKREILHKVVEELSKYYGEQTPFRKLLPLAHPVLGFDEKVAIIDTIFDKWFPTMNWRVRKFEEEFANYMGSEFGVMVNSGSSANLLAIGALKEHFRIKDGSEVILPPICWSTTVFPIVQHNLVPHFVDVNMEDFNINVDSIEEAINENTKIIMVVHTLGFPADMKKIMKISRKNNLLVVEDTCESYGAKIGNKYVGTFGDIATCSFYASHHLTTIEGGMILTNNKDLYETAKSMRAHGWIRDLDSKIKESYIKKYPKIDSRFMFITQGYNMRPTEISGAIGLEQLKKLDNSIEERRKLANFWNSELEKFGDIFYLHKEKPDTRATWLGFPITLNKNFSNITKNLINYLETNGIETRPIISGNFLDQPVMERINYKKSLLPNSEIISDTSFYIGCYEHVTKERAILVINKIKDFIDSKIKVY